MRHGLLVCAIALLVAPSTATAQADSLGLRVTLIDGPGGRRMTEGEILGGVNAADCDDPDETEITFRVDRPPQNAFDLWVALVDNCEATSTRTPPSQTCFDIGAEIAQLQENNSFTLTLAQLIVGTEGDFDRNPCTEVTNPAGSNYFLHAFDSAASSTTGDVSSLPRDVVGIPVDVKAPGAAEIQGGDRSGERVQLTWSAAPGDSESTLYNYEVLNLGPCTGSQPGGDGGPSSGDGGVVGADGGAGTVVARVGAEGTARIDTASLGLAIGEGALIAVRAVDPAGNVGEVSNAVCLTNQPAAGFCDYYGLMGGECSTCSVAAPGSAGGRPVSVLAGFVAALGLTAFRSRGRSRRKSA